MSKTLKIVTIASLFALGGLSYATAGSCSGGGCGSKKAKSETYTKKESCSSKEEKSCEGKDKKVCDTKKDCETKCTKDKAAKVESAS